MMMKEAAGSLFQKVYFHRTRVLYILCFVFCSLRVPGSSEGGGERYRKTILAQKQMVQGSVKGAGSEKSLLKEEKFS